MTDLQVFLDPESKEVTGILYKGFRMPLDCLIESEQYVSRVGEEEEDYIQALSDHFSGKTRLEVCYNILYQTDTASLISGLPPVSVEEMALQALRLASMMLENVSDAFVESCREHPDSRHVDERWSEYASLVRIITEEVDKRGE